MNDGKPIPKKEIVKAKRYSGEHWQYDEAVSYTKKDRRPKPIGRRTDDLRRAE